MRDFGSLNRVILVGRLGQDPDLRYVPATGRPYARFTLATTESFINQSTGERETRTEWHRIVVWGKLAEFAANYLRKGKQILIEGKLRSRTWEGRDGIKRTTTEIEAENIILLGKKEETTEVSEPEIERIEESFPPERDFPPVDDNEDVPF